MRSDAHRLGKETQTRRYSILGAPRLGAGGYLGTWRSKSCIANDLDTYHHHTRDPFQTLSK